ncbi:MAG: diguanylate cyclase, partial [Burkholderiaceae bacterium]|nr:diguanylate cyclase [Burkholderiaceae bacterium]
IMTLNRRFRLNGHLIDIGASIGIAIFPDDATTGQGLLTCADAAMYRAKRSGRNRYCFCGGEPVLPT